MIRSLFRSALCAFLLTPVAMADSGSEAASRVTVAANAPSAWEPEDGDTIRFDVFRKGDKAFGSHTVTFDVESEDSFTATSRVRLKAGLGPITLFRYELDATETWQDGGLVGLQGNTNDDGERERVSAELEDGALQVDGTAYEGEAPAGIIPSSHWNIQQAFSSQILGTESGELLDVDVTRIGRETIVAGGYSVEATHYRLVSDITVDLWYDDQNRWVKLSFEARGQQIDYVLAELY